MTEQGPEQADLTGAALSRSLDEKPPRVSQSLLLWLFEYHPPPKWSQDLGEGGLCPAITQTLQITTSIADWFTNDPRHIITGNCHMNGLCSPVILPLCSLLLLPMPHCLAIRIVWGLLRAFPTLPLSPMSWPNKLLGQT